MFWSKENGIAAMEMVVLFSLVGILTFAVLPCYTNLMNQAHDAKVKAMYSMINASIIVATVDSVTVRGSRFVPSPSQLTLKGTSAWFDSKNWDDNENGQWTYLPTGATIVYNKISYDDYSLVLSL
jgi:hypothetical protein